MNRSPKKCCTVTQKIIKLWSLSWKWINIKLTAIINLWSFPVITESFSVITITSRVKVSLDCIYLGLIRVHSNLNFFQSWILIKYCIRCYFQRPSQHTKLHKILSRHSVQIFSSPSNHESFPYLKVGLPPRPRLVCTLTGLTGLALHSFKL